MPDDDAWLTAWHEAGHAVAGWAFGYRPGESTIVPGKVAGGCTFSYRWRPHGPLPDVGLPLSLWPGVWQRWAAGEAIIWQAGDIAEHLFAPRTGRLPEPIAVVAAERVSALAEELPVTPAERERLTDAMSNPELASDPDQLARLVFVVHGPDPHAGGAWLDWTGEECLRVLMLHRERVRRMAALLAVAGTVGAEAAARTLREP